MTSALTCSSCSTVTVTSLATVVPGMDRVAEMTCWVVVPSGWREIHRLGDRPAGSGTVQLDPRGYLLLPLGVVGQDNQGREVDPQGPFQGGLQGDLVDRLTSGHIGPGRP